MKSVDATSNVVVLTSGAGPSAKTVTETIGCSYFNSAESFAMVRGGHIDLSGVAMFGHHARTNAEVTLKYAIQPGEEAILWARSALSQITGLSA